MTSKLLSQYKQKIRDFKLIPGSGGRFELKANGQLIYSKLETGRFPDEETILKEIGKRLK